MTYLAELMKRLPETSSDVAGAALAAAAARERETRDDLVALCKVPSVVGSSACDDAARLLCHQAQLRKMAAVDVRGGFVTAAARERDPALPTVLLVGDYAVGATRRRAMRIRPRRPLSKPPASMRCRGLPPLSRAQLRQRHCPQVRQE